MKAEQFEELLLSYLKHLHGEELQPDSKERYRRAISDAVAYLEKNIPSELWFLDAAVGVLPEVTSQQERNLQRLYVFLDYTLDKNPPRFLNDVAHGAKAFLFDPLQKPTEHLAIFDASLSIREKYAKGLLAEQHALTDLDLQRMLALTQTQNQIKIVPFSTPSIAATLSLFEKEVEKHSKDNAENNGNLPYLVDKELFILPMIVTLPSEGKNAPHRLAVQITYDRTNNLVSYKIDDSAPLTEKQKENYKRVMNAAVETMGAAHVTTGNLSFPPSAIEGHDQKDEHVNGYWVLHHLLQHQALQSSPEAKNYAQIDAANNKELIRQFFKTQLQDLSIPGDVYAIFANAQQFELPISPSPKPVRVSEKQLTSFLQNMQAPPLAVQEVHESVSQGVGAYSPSEKLISFPLGAKDASLNSIQYTHYFSLLRERVAPSGFKIPTMLLSHSDGEGLRGLNNFLLDTPDIPFTNLSINIDIEKADADLFLKNLQLTLKNLSRHDLGKVELLDPLAALNQAHYEQLEQFIRREQIAVRINLPEAFKKTDLQRQIDTAVGINLRQKNGLSLNQTMQGEKGGENKKDRLIRSRKNIEFTQNLQKDVELQEGVEETVVVIPAKAQVQNNDYDADFQPFSLEDLNEAMASGEPDAFAKFSAVSNGMSKKAFAAYWHKLSSNIVNGELLVGPQPKVSAKAAQMMGETADNNVLVNHQIYGFTDKSLAQIMRFQDHFQDGINIEQLPQGFLLIPDPKHPNQALLHYDPNISKKDTMAPVLVAAAAPDILSIDSTTKLVAAANAPEVLTKIWAALQAGEYSQARSEEFRTFLPRMLALEPQQLEALVGLCGGEEHFDFKKLNFIFSHLAQAKNAYAAPYDEAHETSLISIQWMSDEFPEFTERAAFVNLAHSIVPNLAPQHALFSLLSKENPALNEQLIKASKDFHLTGRELDGVLSVYDKYGFSGVERLLARWESINSMIPLAQLPAVVKNTAGYAALITTDEVVQAIQAIQQFSPEKRKWWDKLYAAHTPQQDDFLTLYKSFNTFSQKIAQYGLTFYKLDEQKPLFKGAENMPATLGRILSILNLCNPADTTLQWQAMSEIDLSAHGALRAITHAQNSERPCGFVVPEMRLGQDKPTGDNLYDKHYAAWGCAHANLTADEVQHIKSTEGKKAEQVIKEKTKALRQEAFYSNLAYQKYRLPLAFYKEVMAKIDAKFPGEDEDNTKTRNQLYSLLLSSTTGDNYRFYLQDSETATAQWEHILEQITDLNLSLSVAAFRETIKQQSVSSLYYLHRAPALPVLDKLITLMMAPFHQEKTKGMFEIKKIMGELEKCDERLKVLLETYEEQIYQGMKFYDDSDYSKNYTVVKNEKPESVTLFEHHLEVSEAVHNVPIWPGMDDPNEGAIKGYLQEQISTFHLGKEDINPLIDIIKYTLARKNFQRVYPQNHPQAGFPVSPLEAREVGVFRAFADKSNQLVPFKTRYDEIMRVGYLYPEGHKEAGKPIPGIIKAEARRIPDNSQNDEQFMWVYVYPENHPLAGQEIPGLEPIKETSNAESLENLNKQQLEEIATQVKEKAPVVAVLREVYFYPKGHPKEGKPVPFEEQEPVGASLKVAYFAPNTQEPLDNNYFVVKKVQANYYPPGSEDKSFSMEAQLQEPVYPQGHPQAGQACDYYIEVDRSGQYKSNVFAIKLFTYTMSLLKDVESIAKAEGKGNLNAADLKAFFYSLNNEMEKMLFEIQQEFVRVDAAHREEQDKLDSELRSLAQESTSPDLLPERKTIIDQRMQELMRLKQDTHLSHDELIEKAYSNVKKDSEGKIMSFVETHLGTHFAKDYFEKLRVAKPSKQIEILINGFAAVLRSDVESIRKHYVDKEGIDEEQQKALLIKLDLVSSRLSLTERLQLLELLKQRQLTDTPLPKYLQLLDAINENGVNSFIYFIQSAERFGQRTSDAVISELAEKATYFLAKALPQIRATESKQVREIDMVDLVIEVITAAKANELQRVDMKVKEVLVNAYQQLNRALMQSNAEEIETALNHLKVFAAPEDMAVFKSLEKELEAFKQKPASEEYEEVPAVYKPVQVPRKTLGGLVARGIGYVRGKKDMGYDTIQELVTEAKMGTRPKTLDARILNEAAVAIVPLVAKLQTYDSALSETFALIKDMVEENSGAKTQILGHVRHYLSFTTTAEKAQIQEAYDHIATLRQAFLQLGDQNLIIGLCENFGAMGRKGGRFNYQDLLNILKGNAPFANYPELPLPVKKQVLDVVNSLINNDRPCTLGDIRDIVDLCADNEHGKLYQQALNIAFENAPFPTVDSWRTWVQDLIANPLMATQTPEGRIREVYNAWSRNPVEREYIVNGKPINGFHLDKAKEQNAQLQGFRYTDEDLEALKQATEDVKAIDTKDLIAEIKTIREDGELQQPHRKDPTRLVALVAELLYRTKGLEPEYDAEGQRQLGRSFEINTTQYLAIHSMLRAGGHVTSQIGTGEGKSRIMMISIACQYALGNTVDFVTADVSLATRDYLEYQAFFNVLGAETRLIKANMPADQYVKGGIHFSDPTNLSLFRNKARSEGNWDLVIDAPKKRALMLDEADKTYFDCSETRFNYSAQADASMRGMEWVYPLLVDFFSQPGREQLYKDDADACNEAFMNFVRPLASKEQMARLEYNPQLDLPVISRNQLEAWQNAALTALHLKIDEDFTLIEDVALQTSEGVRYVTQAQLRADGRASESAKFSFGVHQCLHARLNRVKQNLLPDDSLRTDPLVSERIDKLKYLFHIDGETQIVYSSTSKSLLDQYSEGELLAVTGTAGSIYEKEEASRAFGHEGAEMKFIDVPRHRGQQRVDNPFVLTRNKEQQQQKILKAVLASLEKNQPILLVCENDTESLELTTFLRNNLSPSQQANLERISADTKRDKELEYVDKKAGLPGAITVSTAMLGRGTDIKLHGTANQHGLSVIGTYLPRERDYWQIVGRAGRFGAKGTSQFIFDREREEVRIDRYLGNKGVPLEFYTATEDYLKLLQEKMDSYMQRQRLVKDVVNDFRHSLSVQFFDQFKTQLIAGQNKDEVIGPWQKFVDKSDKLWNDLFPAVQELLAQRPVPEEEINTQLASYQNALQSEWSVLKTDIEVRIKDGKIKPKAGLAEDALLQSLDLKTDPLKLPATVVKLLGVQDKKPILQTPIAEKFDEAYVGRAVIYKNKLDSFVSFFKNIAAAWRGDGPWFPNLKAWRNGNMSTSQFFFGSWGKPLVDAKVKTEEVSAPDVPPQDNKRRESTSMMMKRMPKGEGQVEESAVLELDNEKPVLSENPQPPGEGEKVPTVNSSTTFTI